MRILLADDHDLVRDALAALLCKDDPDITLVTAEDLNTALTMVDSDAPFDVVILDLKMPGMDGLSGATRMIERLDGTPVIMMSGSAEHSDVQSALNIGVQGFVPKTLAGKSLMNAVKLVASGEVYVPMNFMLEKAAQSDAITGGLSPREQDVLFQLRQGLSNKEIARELTITESTVKLHLRSISERLNARNRTEIVIRAIDAGLV